MEENILNIVQVDPILTSLAPSTIEIFAYGITRTSGWTTGRLVPHIYLVPPVDGIYSFDFVANSPNVELKSDSRVKGLTSEFVRGITAIYEWEDFPSDLVGIKVHGLRNSIEAFYNEPAKRITT